MSRQSIQPLILIGHRATGKTTVGRLLAAQLGWIFADVDEYIESTFGGSIAEIFAAEGEAGFRNRESIALSALCGQNRRVIATGGGAILRSENRSLLRSAGFVAWLTAGPETIWARLQSDPTTAARRPNLTSVGGLEEVRALLAAREALYRETADFVANADVPSPEAVAADILNAWTGQLTPPSSFGVPSSSSSA
jgi:shikimate kinase